jgi:hypothetical protein
MACPKIALSRAPRGEELIVTHVRALADEQRRA